jgi:hypothetical protein
MDKKRSYYFGGKSIIEDQNYTMNSSLKNSKFDQNFDEPQPTEYKRSQNNNFYDQQMDLNKTGSQTSYSNLNNFMASSEYKKDENLKTMSNFPSPGSTINQFRQNTLLSRKLVDSLKDLYFKSKGYLESKPDILRDFILEYRNYQTKGLKIPKKIQKFLEFHDEDIFHSLTFYHNEFLLSQSKIKSPINKSNISNKFKTKFTEQTLKRLYPGANREENKNSKKENNLQNFDKFVSKLVSNYKKHFKEFTNDESKLYDYWLRLNINERESADLTWHFGEKNLEFNLSLFLDHKSTIKRISKSFQKICGYECLHPRPLHDYWVRLVSHEDKFLEGLGKYDTDELYKHMEEYYESYRQEVKKHDEQKIKISENQKQKTKKKITKTEFENIIKKFAQFAKPKDKWKTGRVMLNLRRQFKFDNIIKKMIKYEFQTNRVFKFPEEYALYDPENMRKTIFKNSLEKKIKKENEENVKELIKKLKSEDDQKKAKEEIKIAQIIKEDLKLENHIKKMCVKYFRQAETRLTKENNSLINQYLTELYKNMLKFHSKATKRRFPKIKNYGVVKKSRFSNYPKTLKIYFFNLYRRIGVDDEGKIVFANLDSMPFWAPALSNNCKIHSQNCPPYCKNNTQNQIILHQRTKNFNNLFNLDKEKLQADERLHLWKRKDLVNEKSKIFLCLNEAEHCTFEPKINKKDSDVNYLTHEEIIGRRISNKVWVEKMGANFSNRFPLVYKEGVLKKVYNLFNEGKFSEVLKELEEAFDLEAIRAHFDKKFAEKIKKKNEEENKKKNSECEKKHDLHSFKHHVGPDVKKGAEKDDFNNPKNFQICQEVFDILSQIDHYKKSKLRAANSLKNELKIVKELSKEKLNKSSIHLNRTSAETHKNNLEKTNFLKDRYFKFFKTIMCPLK